MAAGARGNGDQGKGDGRLLSSNHLSSAVCQKRASPFAFARSTRASFRGFLEVPFNTRFPRLDRASLPRQTHKTKTRTYKPLLPRVISRTYVRLQTSKLRATSPKFEKPLRQLGTLSRRNSGAELVKWKSRKTESLSASRFGKHEPLGGVSVTGYSPFQRGTLSTPAPLGSARRLRCHFRTHPPPPATRMACSLATTQFAGAAASLK